jgi:hypothetical protein
MEKEKNKKDENNNENNKLTLKLNETSEQELDKYISYLDLANNSNDKILFVKFLFNDVLTIQTPITSISIKEIFEDPSSIIDSYFDKVKNKNNFNNLLNTIKLKFIQKRNILKEKLKECNEHLKIIKKEFINVELENILSNKNNTSKKFTFLNKKVLIYPETNKLNYALSEIFARYMFTSITNDPRKTDSTVDTFYQDSNLNNFMDNTQNPPVINSFDLIENNFKYWIFIIFLISTLFASNSDYTILFNNKEFEKLIDKLVILKTQKKKDGQGDGKKKKKKKGHSGGSKKGIGSILQSQGKDKGQGEKKDGEYKKKNIEESSEKKLYKEIFNKCYVTFTGISDGINLNQIYNGKNNGLDNKYLSIIKNYFTQNTQFNSILYPPQGQGQGQGQSPPGTNSSIKKLLRDIKSVPNLFLPQEDKAKIKVDISDIGQKNQSKITDSMIQKYVNDIIASFDIFQSLRMLQNKNNYEQITLFIKELRKKLVLLLYNLYKFKKNIYEKFIERLNIVFLEENNEELNNTSNKNSSNNSSNTNNSRNTKYTKNSRVQNNFNYSLIPNNKNNIKNNIININKEIVALKLQIQKLDQDNVNYDKKSFELQAKINELYAKRYIMLSSSS